MPKANFIAWFVVGLVCVSYRLPDISFQASSICPAPRTEFTGESAEVQKELKYCMLPRCLHLCHSWTCFILCFCFSRTCWHGGCCHPQPHSLEKWIQSRNLEQHWAGQCPCPLRGENCHMFPPVGAGTLPGRPRAPHAGSGEPLYVTPKSAEALFFPFFTGLGGLRLLWWWWPGEGWGQCY